MNDHDAVALLRRMVETPSLSGEESAVARLLADAMARAGLRAAIDDAGNAVGATRGDPRRGEPGDLVLLGHMDTAPGEVPVRLDGDRLFGRGAVDAKGPLAACVAAAARRLRDPRHADGPRVVVIGAVEEESASSRGARTVIPRYAPGACVIGEPSGWDGVTIGYKGRLLATFRASQPAGHSAGPGPSAPDRAFEWWSRVTLGLPGTGADADSAFARVQASLRSLRTESDGLQDAVEARAGFRLPPGAEPGAIEALCLAAALDVHGTATCEGHEHAIVADRGTPLVRALTGAIRARGARPRLILKTGPSDMNVVGPAWACPIAAYGPGDSALDHTPDEHILLSEFVRGIEVLAAALATLTAPPACPADPAEGRDGRSLPAVR